MPTEPFHHSWLASAYALKGETERAAAELAEAQRLAGESSFSSIAHVKAEGCGGSRRSAPCSRRRISPACAKPECRSSDRRRSRAPRAHGVGVLPRALNEAVLTTPVRSSATLCRSLCLPALPHGREANMFPVGDQTWRGRGRGPSRWTSRTISWTFARPHHERNDLSLKRVVKRGESRSVLYKGLAFRPVSARTPQVQSKEEGANPGVAMAPFAEPTVRIRLPPAVSPGEPVHRAPRCQLVGRLVSQQTPAIMAGVCPYSISRCGEMHHLLQLEIRTVRIPTPAGPATARRRHQGCA
jgi:hypothetical protein